MDDDDGDSDASGSDTESHAASGAGYDDDDLLVAVDAKVGALANELAEVKDLVKHVGGALVALTNVLKAYSQTPSPDSNTSATSSPAV